MQKGREIKSRRRLLSNRQEKQAYETSASAQDHPDALFLPPSAVCSSHLA